MGHANAIFTTTGFSQEWGDPPDAHPPPGHALAQALVSALASEAECTVLTARVDDDDWDHSSWFFWVTFGDVEYRAFLECTIVPENSPGLWRLSFDRRLGCLTALFGRRSPTDLPESVQLRVEAALQRVADARDIRWGTDEDAEEALYG